MTYTELKRYLSERRDQVVLVLCFGLVFLAGFGLGRYEKPPRRERVFGQPQYTTNRRAEPAVAPAGEQATTSPGATAAQCAVKGNISSTGKKIYHVSGGAFYDRVNPEQCFGTEAEARAAGFVRSSR